MSIKNRIEKLENAAGVNSEFCTCRREILTRVIAPDLDRTETEYETLIAEAQKPEYCELCSKQIEKRLIIVQAVRGHDGPDHPATPGEPFATFNIGTRQPG